MLLKPDVKIDGLSPELYYAAGVADTIHRKLSGHPLVVTSALDGTHNPGSLHPKGKALDLRTLDLTHDEALAMYDELNAILNPQGFDVVWEGAKGATPATTAMHIHVEFDPKAGEKFLSRV